MSKSNVVPLIASDSGDKMHLGPAEVIEVEGPSIEVLLESGARSRPTLAMATSYEPRVGDIVLVVSQAARSFVIGVIHAKGPTVLSFEGDVELRSLDGAVKIAAARGIELEAQETHIRTDRLSVTATALVQRVVSVTQRVRDLVSIHVGRRHEVIEEASHLQAKSATITTQDDVKINGKTIHLG